MSDFVKIIKSSKELIFHQDDIPKKQQMSQVHVIVLQMITTGMIEFFVTDKTKLGTEAMGRVNVSIKTMAANIKCYERTYAT